MIYLWNLEPLTSSHSGFRHHRVRAVCHAQTRLANWVLAYLECKVSCLAEFGTTSTVTDNLATITAFHPQIVSQSQDQMQSESSPQRMLAKQPTPSQEESGELSADLTNWGHQSLQLDSASPDKGLYKVLLQVEGESAVVYQGLPPFSDTHIHFLGTSGFHCSHCAESVGGSVPFC